MNRVEQKGIQELAELAKLAKENIANQSKQITTSIAEADKIALDNLSAEHVRANFATSLNGGNYGRYSTALSERQLERQRVWAERLDNLKKSESLPENAVAPKSNVAIESEQDKIVNVKFIQELTNVIKKHENDYIDGDIIMEVCQKLRSREYTAEKALKLLSDSCTNEVSNISNPVPFKEALFYLRTY